MHNQLKTKSECKSRLVKLFRFKCVNCIILYSYIRLAGSINNKKNESFSGARIWSRFWSKR